MAANTSVATGAGGVCSASPSIRASVAKTQFGYGNAVAASTVVSVSQDMPMAYPDTECNMPAIA